MRLFWKGFDVPACASQSIRIEGVAIVLFLCRAFENHSDDVSLQFLAFRVFLNAPSRYFGVLIWRSKKTRMR